MATTGRNQKTRRTAGASSPAKLSSESERWVAQTLKRMSVDEKIGQLFSVFYYGGFTSVESPEYQELIRDVEQKHIGSFAVATQSSPLGIHLSQAYPTAVLANSLQSHAKVPLLIGADFERGTAFRIAEGTSFPRPMAVAAAGRPEDAYTMGKITAIEARAIGVPWIFAPDADVNNNPDNPVINVRSFGEDPARVSEFVTAFIRGIEENGGLATAKHFPGHGDTTTDSHIDMPTVGSDRRHLEQIELPPFRAAIAAGVGSIMTAHLDVPALDSTPELPATLSHKITTDLLRGEMGFDRLIVTDDLRMGGVTNRYPPGEVAVRALLAGVDILLQPQALDASLEAVRDAVVSGRIPMSRIDDSVTRVLQAKAKLGLDNQKLVDLNSLAKAFHRPEFDRVAQDIADRGITLLREDLRILPLDSTKPPRLLLVAVSGNYDRYPALHLEQELRARVDSLTTIRTDTKFSKVDSVKLPSPETYDVAIAAIFVRVVDSKGSIGLPDDQAALVNLLLAAGKPVIVACFGSPYIVQRFPGAKTWVAAFCTADVSERAVGRALFGQIPIGGRLPVNIPGAASLGAGLDLTANSMKLRPGDAATVAKLKPAYEVLDRAVVDRAFPGGVLAVGYRNELFVHAFGRQTYDAKSPAVTADTIYDAASLTKAVVTTSLVASQVEAGRIALDAPVARYIPEWAESSNTNASRKDWGQAVTVRHLLTHTSGLPAHKDYFLKNRSAREVIARLCAEPLEYPPGKKSVYSDLGFILLGEILNRVTGEDIDQLAHEKIFAPLGMTNTTFNPLKSLRDRIAPTENDAAFRRRQLTGEVHDENAFTMGGVAGHAGMFSTAPDLAAFSQMLLNGGMYAHKRFLNRATIAQFTAAQQLSAKTRTLGWNVPTSESSSGHYFSAKSYGHTGFTGTSIWIDPDHHLFVILLTNRVYPTRENNKIAGVRPVLHDAVVTALGLTNP